MMDKLQEDVISNKTKIEILQAQVRGVSKRLNEIEEKLDRHNEANSGAFNAVHSRITRLEIRVAYFAGAAAAVGGAIGAAASQILHL